MFDAPPAPALVEAYVRDPAQRLILAIAGDLAVGQVKTVLHRHPEKPPTLFVEELGVAPDWRRQGIGTRLVHEALRLAEEFGCAELWLATEPGNDAARALYLGAGLEPQTVVMFSRRIAPSDG